VEEDMRVYSIFRSIDGEVNLWGQGSMCTFIRLAGCNLNCNWCDTEYARDPKAGKNMSILDIMVEVQRLKSERVTITGGEPYEQIEELEELVHTLYHNDFLISIETNGSHEPMWCSNNPSHVVDYKLPSSGMDGFMLDECFFRLGKSDFVKFVVRDSKDFAIATHVRVDLIDMGCKARFAFSSVSDRLHPTLLLQWMDREELHDCILNVQLHKLLELKEDQ
jgi:7-carboxy-7-deazaguanine synthase